MGKTLLVELMKLPEFPVKVQTHPFPPKRVTGGRAEVSGTGISLRPRGGVQGFAQFVGLRRNGVVLQSVTPSGQPHPLAQRRIRQ